MAHSSLKKNLWAGYGIWECVQQSTAWFIAPIHVAIRQFIRESSAIRPHIQVFLHVVSHCWPRHTKLWLSFPCRLHWVTFNRSANRCTCFQARCFSPTPRPVCNTSKSERSFFPIQQCRCSWRTVPGTQPSLGTWFVPCAVSHAPTHLPPSAPR